MPIDRRELLATFLGIPFAMGLSGCGRRSQIALPPGEVVGASHEFGHVLRAGSPPDVADDAWREVYVLIVGGGVAGLTAARQLARSGVDDFLVLELEKVAGGTSRSGESDVVAYPWGAHYVPAPTRENPQLVALFEELDVFEGEDEHGDPVVAEPFLCRDPRERLFFKGDWYEGLYPSAGASDDDLRQLARFRELVDAWIGWRDARGRRAFTIPVSRCSDDPIVTALDDVTMATWLDEQQLDSARLRWYVDLACRDDYGLKIDQTSAWAGLFYFAARTRNPGEDSRPFVTWPQGNGRIVEHLRSIAGDRIQTGWAVASLETIDDERGMRVEAVAIDADGNARGFRARRVVFAAPRFVAPYVIRGYRDDERLLSSVLDFEYGAWLAANVHLSKHPHESGFARAWDNVLYESPSLGYVSATHQAGIDHGPTVLTYYLPLAEDDNRAARERLLATGRDEWAEVVLSDLERAHPEIREIATRLDVVRWGHAMIQPRPNFMWGPSRRAAAEPFGGIHFAHSDLSGIALFEEAFDHGTRAANEVVAALA